MAKRTSKSTKGQTSNLVKKLGESQVAPSISDNLKGQVSNFRSKFNTINISNYVTGVSSTSKASVNYGNQSTVHSIAGKKVGTATQIPQLSTPATEAKGDETLLVYLSKMFSFMQQNRENDIKRRETGKLFEEENQSEEQRRHLEFLNVLKEYTSTEKTTTLVPPPGNVDKIEGGQFEMFPWLKPLARIIPKIAGFFLTNPIGIALLAGATLLSLLALDEKGEETSKGILNAYDSGAMGAEIMKQQGENIEPEEIRKKNSVVQALLKDAPLATKYQGYKRVEYLEKLGVPKQQVTQLLDNTQPLVVPDKLKSIDPELYESLKATRLPSGVTPSTAGAGRGLLGGPTAAELQGNAVGGGRGVINPQMATESTPGGGRGTINPEMATESTPTAVSVPPTPTTAAVNDVISKNADLVMEDSTSPGGSQPIIASSTSSSNSVEKEMPVSATQRDDTAIINRVFGRMRAGV